MIDIDHNRMRIYDSFKLLDALTQDVVCEILDRILLLPVEYRMATANELCRIRNIAMKDYEKRVFGGNKHEV